MAETISTEQKDILHNHLLHLYGEERAPSLVGRIAALIESYRDRLSQHSTGRQWVDERDAVLITYADSIIDSTIQSEKAESAELPLATLCRALKDWRIDDLFSTVHLLPFFPYSSDDGFSVIDYYQVNPSHGDWSHIAALRQHFALMFDAVLNHTSQHCDWFQSFLGHGGADIETFRHFYIDADPAEDYSAVVRPRNLPLLSEFTRHQPSSQQSEAQDEHRRLHVWTTFSADQVDLNYRHPDVLLQMLDVLLTYVSRGARILRLDAVGFLWKTPGTSCMHLPETHRLIKLMRLILDMAAPGTLLITETNVPHRDNISYFGDGTDEAHMVYQFPLPPLVTHTMQSGDAAALSQWAAGLSLPQAASAAGTPQTTFFNFLASHDGIGLRPLQGLVSEAEVARVIAKVQERGGLVSYGQRPGGERSPYELNISYIDAIGSQRCSDSTRSDMFTAAHSIMLALAGVPGIYIHSLLGSRSDRASADKSGHARAINRAKLEHADVGHQLADPSSLRARILANFRRLLGARQSCPAFHPNAAQKVLDLGNSVFAVVRGGDHERRPFLAITNVTDQPITVSVDRGQLGGASRASCLLQCSIFHANEHALRIPMAPYQTYWFELEDAGAI